MTEREAFDVEKGLSASNLLLLRSVLNNIQHHPHFYETHQDRLATCDLAFFSHGASLDDGPREHDAFHQALTNFRQGTNDGGLRNVIQLRMKRAIFDLAAMLDQMTGGATLVVSMPGALVPGSPPTSEHIKANVYIPKVVLKEIERQGRPNPVPDIVQTVIREIGEPTVVRFERAREKRWAYKRGQIPTPRPLPQIDGMPMPMPAGSSRYLFYGRGLRTMPDPTAYFASDLPSDEADFDPEDPEGFFTIAKPTIHDHETNLFDSS
ncbi:hypothetical protein EST38_g13321 [Candolleomyces aberdarensis]|uniref:Uncharacterized protein n=1 Tax=Candolleomyces aberdarensis TaxID=2316362 RepID=A0A4Q2D080_9AGAR|nr:hypothetical protein EST38_g13321 [Candolleomyces aberdarensis]